MVDSHGVIENQLHNLPDNDYDDDEEDDERRSIKLVNGFSKEKLFNCELYLPEVPILISY